MFLGRLLLQTKWTLIRFFISQLTIFQLCRDRWVEPDLPGHGLISTKQGLRTQRTDTGEALTRGPSFSSQALYHSE